MTARGHRRVDRILAFSNGRFLASGTSEVPRADLASKSRESDRLGFKLGLSAPLGRASDVQVFAVTGRTAVPLALLCPAGAEQKPRC